MRRVGIIALVFAGLLASACAATRIVAAHAGNTCLQDLPTVLRQPVALPVSDGFGMRVDPLLQLRRMHQGIDFAGPSGTVVSAAATGVVEHVGRDGRDGLVVVLQHAPGFITRYAHLQRITVKTGDCAKTGDTIGRLGSTGLSAAPHLHFEVIKDDQPVDPASFFGSL